MYKNIAKTESVAEFIARGGSVKKVTAKGPKRSYNKAVAKVTTEAIDVSALPEALRIKFGLR